MGIILSPKRICSRTPQSTKVCSFSSHLQKVTLCCHRNSVYLPLCYDLLAAHSALQTVCSGYTYSFRYCEKSPSMVPYLNMVTEGSTVILGTLCSPSEGKGHVSRTKRSLIAPYKTKSGVWRDASAVETTCYTSKKKKKIQVQFSAPISSGYQLPACPAPGDPMALFGLCMCGHMPCIDTDRHKNNKTHI